MWSVINQIVAESCQQNRFDTRAATFEVLAEVMRLRRERVIFRYKRKWIASLDSGQPNIPLNLKTAVGTTDYGMTRIKKGLRCKGCSPGV
jgi:hypothetical protein